MSSPLSHPPPVVLVVDDDPELVELFLRFLSRHGLEGLAAYSGRQCLEKVRHHAVDVIVLDVMMPGLDGLAVCAALKKRKETRCIPIILLSASDDAEICLAGMRSGASEFLVKPVRGQDLLASIRTHIETGRKVRQMDHALTHLSEESAEKKPGEKKSSKT